MYVPDHSYDAEPGQAGCLTRFALINGYPRFVHQGTKKRPEYELIDIKRSMINTTKAYRPGPQGPYWED